MLGVLVLLSSVSWGTTWYVATNGDDDPNGGDSENPFATINYAIDQSSNGDAIIAAQGTYEENVACSKRLHDSR